MARRGKTIYAPGQQVMFAPKSEWIPPNINELPSWKGIKRIGIDTETRDPTLKQRGIGVRHDGYVVGISFAIEDGPGFYLPIRHDGGGNLEESAVLDYLRDQAKEFTGDIAGAHLQYDLDYLAQERIEFKCAQYFRDVQIADPLLNELHYRYSLEAIAERHNEPGKDEELLKHAAAVFGINPKADLWRLHSKYVGPYATEDAALPLRILRKQERLIDEEELWEIYNLESQLLPVLVKMRRRGVRIDQEAMSRAEEWTLVEEKRLLDEVHRLTGCQVGVGNVWKAEAMALPLRSVGVKLALDKNNNPMVNASLLIGLDHPIGALLLRARKINKARTTFIDSIKTHMSNGRIHATFNQLKREKDDGSDGTEGAAYGRLSCVHPNLQQQPSPDRDPEIGMLIRSLYLPDEGGIWAANDFSQQEPKWLTHFAEICGLREAAETAERYRQDPTTDNHDMMTALIHGENIKCEKSKKEYKRLRFICKTIFLALCYGMGGKKLALKLGLPTRWLVLASRRRKYYFDYEDQVGALEKVKSVNRGRIIEVAGAEAQGLLDKFNEAVPYVRDLAGVAEKRAKKKGYITTVLGRRCRFPVDDNGNFDYTHKSLNRLVQGSSGDQAKKAMIDLDAEGYYLQIQVHDELGNTVENEKQARWAAEIMANCVPCNIPHRVDVELGRSWGEAA